MACAGSMNPGYAARVPPLAIPDGDSVLRMRVVLHRYSIAAHAFGEPRLVLGAGSFDLFDEALGSLVLDFRLVVDVFVLGRFEKRRIVDFRLALRVKLQNLANLLRERFAALLVFNLAMMSSPTVRGLRLLPCSGQLSLLDASFANRAPCAAWPPAHLSLILSCSVPANRFRQHEQL